MVLFQSCLGVRELAQRASIPGGVGGRGTGPRDGANFATCVVFLSFQGRSKCRNVCRIFYTSRTQPSNFRKIIHLPFRNRSPCPPEPLPPRVELPSKPTLPGLASFWNSQPSPNPPPFLELPSSPYAPQPSPATKALLPPSTRGKGWLGGARFRKVSKVGGLTSHAYKKKKNCVF